MAVINKNSHHVKMIDEYFLPRLKSSREGYASKALETKTEFEKTRTATASSLKPRRQWIASMINSGALPTWEWDTWQSTAGPIMSFCKRNPPTELDASISFSEHELEQIFEKGQPHAVGIPPTLPPDLVKALTDGSVRNDTMSVNPDPLKAFRPSPSSILMQTASSEPVQLATGMVGTKVVLKNTLADGKVVVKEFIQEPAKVLEEVENARKSFEMLRQGVSGILMSNEIKETLGNAFEHHDGGDLLE